MPRLVVTASDSQGKAVVAVDREVKPVTASSRPGFAWHRFWGSDSLPHIPTDGAFVLGSAFPPPGGLRVIQVTFPPGTGVDDKYDAVAFRSEWSRAMAESTGAAPSARIAPGADAHRAPHSGGVREQTGGLHATNSVDLGFVMSGEINLELDDGQEVALRTGDVLIQNGTRHAWRNRSGKPCVIGLILVGAEMQPRG